MSEHTESLDHAGSGAAVLVLLLAAVAVGIVMWIVATTPDHIESTAPEAPVTDSAKKFPVHIRKPAGPPVVHTGLTGPDGQPVTVACNTCHADMKSNPSTRHTADLDLFHQGLKVAHGDLSCVSCHNPADGYASLRLADGTSVPYTEVMTLCAQCHGPQYRDYLHGSHGGMTGYWDLTKGPRKRNNCVDCHDPHSPKYPEVTPAPGPRDRFLNSGHGDHHE